MTQRLSSERGMTLVEVLVALGVLVVGMLGAASVLTQGMNNLVSSPGDVVATQKATEAIEAVFAARDSHKLTWSQIRNVYGASADGGIFVDGPQAVRVPGADGLVNTSDDGAVESTTLPGRDQIMGTGDDTTITLNGYTREIEIRDVPDSPPNCGAPDVPCNLRSIKVTITFQSGPLKRTYTLTTYISNYA
jgi:prepilin-type N-terminal cleavage/methylation domain-containing protein